MEIQGIEFSVPMENLYTEVESLLLPNKLYLYMVNQMDSEISRVGGGACAIPLPNRDFKIEFTKNDSFKEYSLSHELLHVLLDIKGFPNVFLYTPDNTNAYQTIHDTGQFLNNIILHKIIIEEQLKRGFHIEEARKDRFESIVSGYQIPESSTEVLRLTSFMIEAEDYIKEYQDRISNRYPSIYKRAKYLYEAIRNISYKTPFETRRALIKAFKEFDKLLIDNSLSPMELNKKTCLST